MPAPPIITLSVAVKPRSAVSELSGPGEGGVWQARLKSPPVDGKANAELIALVAARFGCRRQDVTVKSGAGGRRKLIQIRSVAS